MAATMGDTERLSSSSSNAMQSWFTIMIVAPLYIAYRVAMVNRMAMSDCDEVYNYWEPLTFLLQTSASTSSTAFTTSTTTTTALQTWEYAHDYQLRTYAYLVPLQLVTQYVLQPLLRHTPFMHQQVLVESLSGGLIQLTNATTTSEAETSGVVLICLLRALISALAAAAEVYFLSVALPLVLSGLHRRRGTGSRQIGDDNNDTSMAMLQLYTMCSMVLATSTGLTHASGALLPSSTWMSVWCICAGALLRKQDVVVSVAAILATLSTGWPFGAVSVVPMALYVLYRQASTSMGITRLVRFVVVLIFITAVVQAAVCLVDYEHYGVWTLPTVNIFTYNAGGNGDTLYGVEPVSYYVKNLLLNLNVVAVLGIMSLVIYPVTCALGYTAWDGHMLGMLATMPAWMAITFPRPHKEERFLFPMYPVLVLGAIFTVDVIVSHMVVPLLVWILPDKAATTDSTRTATLSTKSQKSYRVTCHALVWTPVILLSMSRTAALQRYYSAPLSIYSAISAENAAVSAVSETRSGGGNRRNLVCVCGEWYRNPGTLYMSYLGSAGSTTGGSGGDGLQLGFLPSSFKGQLPQAFTRHGSTAASRELLQPFNDQNLEQTERYVSHPADECAYVVDLISLHENDSANDTCLQQVTGSSGSNSNGVSATVIKSVPFLDGERTATLHRTLYAPYLHESAMGKGQVTYQTYVLYRIDPSS